MTALERFREAHYEAWTICKKVCPYLGCSLSQHLCPVHTEILFRTIILRMGLDLERLGIPMIRFLEGKYKVFRLDSDNLLVQKKVMKKLRKVKVRNAKGKVTGEKTVGGYEGYVDAGYHPDLESAITSIIDDVMCDGCGDAETIVPLKAFRKNVVKMKNTLVEEVREAGVCECKFTREDDDDDDE